RAAELLVTLVARCDGLEGAAALARVDVGVGRGTDDLRRHGDGGYRGLEVGVRAQPGPGREPAPCAHAPREPLAVVAGDRVTTEREDGAGPAVGRVEREVEVSRVGERPIDEQVVALERAARDERSFRARQSRLA